MEKVDYELEELRVAALLPSNGNKRWEDAKFLKDQGFVSSREDGEDHYKKG